jgi:hypothetical protein
VREAKQGGTEVRLPAKDGAAEAAFFIPDGCRVMFDIWSVHRDPRYWQEPEEFRWGILPPPFAWVPSCFRPWHSRAFLVLG